MERHYLVSSLEFRKKLKNVSDSEYKRLREAYDDFLEQPLKLEMFVPVDQNGNVLSEPQMIEKRLGFDEVEMDYDYAEVEIYKKAKEKVLFKDATVMPVEDYYIVKIGGREVWITWTERTIEDIQHINRAYEVDFELTESAINQLGL